jgi:hypothetical protein
MKIHRRFLSGVLKKPLNAPIMVVLTGLAFSACGTALAQSALAGSDIVLPPSAPSNADLIHLKTADSGGFDSFKIVVTNSGSVAVTGVVVKDQAGNGGPCASNNPVPVTGSGTPEGAFKISDLTSSGIALGTLSSGQSAILSYSCRSN